MAPTDHDLIGKWLGLPPGSWPPDHYALLGLAPGDRDLTRIEQQVHARLARVRGYQLSHPGPATEAMNRLAQAFACLTDPRAKQAYDAATFPGLAPAPPEPAPEPVPVAVLTATTFDGAADTLVSAPQTRVEWHGTAPPVRLPGPSTETPMPGAIAGWPPAHAPQSADASSSLSSSGVLKVARRADPVFDTAHASPEARRGLGTRRALFERVTTTRELLRLWDRAGRYLGRAQRKLSRPAEEKDLVRVLNEIDEVLHHFPPLLGEPGKPGYRVTALVHEDAAAAVLKAMDFDQRDAVARDWLAGQTLLQSHLEFLRKELDALRRCGWCGRAARAVSAALDDHPAWVYAGVLLVLGATAAVFLLA